MKKYEKAIVKSIEMNTLMSVQEFSHYIDSYGTDIIEFLFNYIN